MRQRLGVLLVALLVGCSDTLVPPPDDPLGTWAANFDVVGSSLILTLHQTYGNITGAGSYAIEAGRAGTLRVTGSYSAPAITLKLFYDFDRVDTYSGTFQDDAHLKGIVADAQGKYSYPLTFTRQ